MKNWLIKILGGFTRSEFEALGIACDARVEVMDKIGDYERQVIATAMQENRRLTDIMLTRAGFIQTEQTTEPEKKARTPMNNREPWPVHQKRLERDDARLQAERTKQYWKQKEAASSVPDGTGNDESSTLGGPLPS